MLMSKLTRIPILDLALMDHDLYFDLEPRQRGIGRTETGRIKNKRSREVHL